MQVFISGMPRSGSTYSFNVVRRALSRRGGVSAILDGAIKFKNDGRSHAIYKAHDADDELVSKIRDGTVKSICTIRRPENAVLSWLNTFGGEPAEVIDAVMLPWMRLYERIAKHSLVISMEEIESRRFSSTWKIGRYACGDYSPLEWLVDCRQFSKNRVTNMLKDVEAKRRNIVDAGGTYYDKETLFHRRHISDRSKFDSRAEVLLDIRQRLALWLDDRGNLIRLT